VALNELGLGILLTAKDMASGTIEKVRGEFEQLGAGAESAGALFQAGLVNFAQGAAVFGAGLAVVTGAYSLAEAAMPFEEAIARAGARSADFSKDLDGLRAAAAAASREVGVFSETQAAQTLATITQEGFSAADSIEQLIPTLHFARAAMMEPTMAAGFLTDALSEFGMQSSEAGAFTDKLAFAMRKWGIVGEELPPMLYGMASATQLTGASFDDLLLSVGLVKSVFPQATKAAGAINMALNQLTDPAYQKAFKKTFVGIPLEANGALRPLIDIMADVYEKTKGLSDAARGSKLVDVFGARGAGALNAMLQQLSNGVETATGELVYGADAVEELRKQMAATGGTTKEMADAMGAPTDAFKSAGNAWQNFKTTIGRIFLPIFEKAISGVGKAVDWLTKGFKALPAPVQNFLGAFIPIFGAALMVAGGLKMMIGMFQIAKAAMIALKIVSVATNTALAVGLIGLLITAAVLIVQNWDTVKAFFVAFGEKFVEIASNIKAALSSAWGEIAARWNRGVARIHAGIHRIGAFFTDDIPSAAREGAEMIVSAFWATVDRIGRFFSEDIPNAIRAAYGTIKSAVMGIPVIGDILGVMGAGWDWVTGPAATGGPSAALAARVQEARAGAPVGPAEGPAPAVALLQGGSAGVGRNAPPPTPSRGSPTRTEDVTHIAVNIDGQQVGEAFARRAREDIARSFGPVPEEA